MTKIQIILDESGEKPIPSGFDVVKTEVEFLQKDGAERLWVSGQPCRYARKVYKARCLPLTDLESPRIALKRLAGVAADEVSSEVLLRCSQIIERDGPRTLGELLASLTNEAIWNATPSLEHAAGYLLVKIDDDLFELCDAQRKLWAKVSSEKFFSWIYLRDIRDRENTIQDWLLKKEVRTDLGEFPLELDAAGAASLQSVLGNILRSSNGAAIDDFPKQSPNRRAYGHAILEYFSHHIDHISSNSIATVSSLLSADELSTLQGLLSQSEIAPISIDSEVGPVLSWVTDKYLPFRESQMSVIRPEDADILASSFVDWLLNNYHKLTYTDRDKSQINVSTFHTVKRLAEQNWVLWVVVDGLSFMNHQKLIRRISEKSCQLRVAENVPLLAVLPTITEKAKYGLTTGRFASENKLLEWKTEKNFLAEFPEGVYAGNNGVTKLTKGLKCITPTVVYWNYTVIDECYHKNTDLGPLNIDVDGHLNTLANHIDDMVSKAHDPNRVAVVICSDHGQLTRRCSKIDVDLGDNRAHGRTILLTDGQPFADCNLHFVKNIDEKTVDLNPKSFRLSEPARVALGPKYFADFSANSLEDAIGVHGGLFPEEVVVGLAVLTRQPVYKDIKTTMSGSGETGRPGIVHLHIDNPNSLILNPLSVSIDGLKLGGQGDLLLAKVAPHDTLDMEIPIDQFPQPSEADIFHIAGVLLYEFDGITMETSVSGTLNCNSLYNPKNPGLLSRF